MVRLNIKKYKEEKRRVLEQTRFMEEILKRGVPNNLAEKLIETVKCRY